MECLGRFEVASDLLIFEIKDKCPKISDVTNTNYLGCAKITKQVLWMSRSQHSPATYLLGPVICQ